MKIAFIIGSGISKESGIPTFRDSDGLWENYPVMKVASHQGWLSNPNFVNDFYNMLRKKFLECKPNEAHKIVAELEKDHEVVVVTQNVDNLHEQAGSTNVIHLHGELMKVCSSKNVENEKFWRTLEPGEEVMHDKRCEDGGRVRPYIVFFNEPVPNIAKAANAIKDADIAVVIGTSLQVYPAASLIEYCTGKVYVIDPNPPAIDMFHINVIAKPATEGMRELAGIIKESKDDKKML